MQQRCGCHHTQVQKPMYAYTQTQTCEHKANIALLSHRAGLVLEDLLAPRGDDGLAQRWVVDPIGHGLHCVTGVGVG